MLSILLGFLTGDKATSKSIGRKRIHYKTYPMAGIKRSLSQIDDVELRMDSSAGPPPAFDDIDDIDAELLNEDLTSFFHTWIPETMRIFASTGAAVHTRDFWASQMRTDLDYQLWRMQYLGHEPTEEELDWLVDAALSFNWHRIETLLDRRSSEDHVQSPHIPGPEEVATSLSERRSRGSPPRTKLRRALALENIMSKMSVNDCDNDRMSDVEGYRG